jgi:hypothetical protein
MTDLYTAQHEGLVTIHRAIFDAFAPVIAGTTSSLETLIPQARDAAGFLLGHHEMESTTLFPGLRKHGRLRSTDVAFLDARDRDHEALHHLCEALIATTSALHPHAATLAAQARDLVAILEPHTREEELGLAPARLREMIDERGLIELGRDLEAKRAAVLARIAAHRSRDGAG